MKSNAGTHESRGHYHKDGRETYELQSAGGTVRRKPGDGHRRQEWQELFQGDSGEAGSCFGPRHHRQGGVDMSHYQPQIPVDRTGVGGYGYLAR